MVVMCAWACGGLTCNDTLVPPVSTPTPVHPLSWTYARLAAAPWAVARTQPPPPPPPVPATNAAPPDPPGRSSSPCDGAGGDAGRGEGDAGAAVRRRWGVELLVPILPLRNSPRGCSSAYFINDHILRSAAPTVSLHAHTLCYYHMQHAHPFGHAPYLS